jgi:thymidylate kinase
MAEPKEKQKQIIFLNRNKEIQDYPIEIYKECGLKIDLTFAIDLTISNGNYRKGEESLHTINADNKYIQIMKEVYASLQEYLKKESITQALGYGAKQI